MNLEIRAFTLSALKCLKLRKRKRLEKGNQRDSIEIDDDITTYHKIRVHDQEKEKTNFFSVGQKACPFFFVLGVGEILLVFPFFFFLSRFFVVVVVTKKQKGIKTKILKYKRGIPNPVP